MTGKRGRPKIAALVAALAMPWALTVGSQSAVPPAASSASDVTPVGSPGCPWPEVSGVRLLDRPLGSLSLVAKTVGEIVHALIFDHHVPLSFIEIDSEVKLTVELREATVRTILDAIVARFPRYRYEFISSRLVLYPRDSAWDTQRLGNLRFGPGPRRRVAIDLIEELRRVPAFADADLRDPWLFGNPETFVFQDPVELKGPASPIELLVQLLGERASAVFSVNKLKGTRGTPLWLETASLVQSLAVVPSSANLVRRDQTAQLNVVGTLHDGTRKNLTPRTCGTQYSASNSRVIAVSSEGLVTARGEGEAMVIVTNEQLAGATVKVTLPGHAAVSPPVGR
jgi:hypothetical protein